MNAPHRNADIAELEAQNLAAEQSACAHVMRRCHWPYTRWCDTCGKALDMFDALKAYYNHPDTIARVRAEAAGVTE